MSKKCRTIYSLAVSLVFMALSLACISSADQTTDECDFLPNPVSKTQTIDIKVYNKLTKLPIPNFGVSISSDFNRKEPNGINCIFTVSNDYFSTTGNAVGIAKQEITNTFESDDDHLNLNISAYHSQYFSQPFGTTIYFNESSKTLEVYLVPYDEEP